MVWRGSPGRGFAASRDELVVFLRLCSLTLQPSDSEVEEKQKFVRMNAAEVVERHDQFPFPRMQKLKEIQAKTPCISKS